MGINFYFLSFRQSFKPRFFIALATLVFIAGTAKAQYYNGNSDNRFGAALMVGYDAPVGDLAYTFKPTQTYGASFLWNNGNVTASVTFGYHAYQPKLDTFYYQVDAANYGTVHYSNFTVYSLYLGVAYNLKLTDEFKIYGGFNLGVYNTHNAFQSADEFVGDSEDLSEQDAYLAPKLGLTYSINDNISLGIEGKFNYFAPTGKAADNPLVGTIYSSYAANFVLTYNF